MMELLCNGEFCSLVGEDNKFFAAISYNPSFLWVKFFLTDNKPNENGKVIPRDEFSNIIRTATFAPIKIFYSELGEGGHKFSKPIGVITHLMVQDEDEDYSRVVGIAAIWKEEYPEIAEYIKNKIESGDKVRVSWELYAGKVEAGKDGVDVLRDIIVTAVTIVKNPAYGDRTPIFEVSELEGEFEQSAVWSRAYINDLPDCAFLYIEPGGKKDEDGKTTPRSLRHLPVKNHNCEIDLPHLRNAIQRLSQPKTGVSGGKRWLTEDLRKKLLNKARRMLEKAKKEESEMEELLEQLKSENAELKAKIEELQAENEELREFKNKIEAEMNRQRRLLEIKEKFQQAGLEKDDEYFEQNAERLLKLEDDALEFIIQELLAFKAKAEKEEDDTKKKEEAGKVPNFPDGDLDLKTLARQLIRKERGM